MQAVSGWFFRCQTWFARRDGTLLPHVLHWIGAGSILVLACVMMYGTHRTIPLLPGRSSFSPALALGSGAGGSGAEAVSPLDPAAPSLCNPLDTTCFASGVAAWVATQLQNALQPLDDQILQNPVDIIDQTPAEDSYQNSTILAINNALIAVADAGLACVLIIAGYTVIIGPYLQIPHATISGLVPRAVLVMCTVHFNQFFLGLFIELENQLCLVVIHLAGLSLLTNLLVGLFTTPLTGLIFFVLIVVLAILVVGLLVQMITRIALVALALATAPLGLFCLFLPQTLRWGKLWLSLFASAVMVQFLQVVALGLGGALLTAIVSTSLVRLDKQLATAFMAIGVLFLVLKIPGMLNNWSLQSMMERGGSRNNSGDGQGGGKDSGEMGGGGKSADVGMGAAEVLDGSMMTDASGATVLLF